MRHHILESVLQKAVKRAAQKAEQCNGFIAKRFYPLHCSLHATLQKAASVPGTDVIYNLTPI